MQKTARAGEGEGMLGRCSCCRDCNKVFLVLERCWLSKPCWFLVSTKIHPHHGETVCGRLDGGHRRRRARLQPIDPGHTQLGSLLQALGTVCALPGCLYRGPARARRPLPRPPSIERLYVTGRAGRQLDHCPREASCAPFGHVQVQERFRRRLRLFAQTPSRNSAHLPQVRKHHA